MKIYSWNVNGIRAVIKKGNWQSFISEHSPDIICLQETKATEDQVDISLLGYEKYWFSADKKGYSGTAIFTKEIPQSMQKGFSEKITKKYCLIDDYGDTTKEGRLLTLEFENFFLVTVYTPNAKDDLSRIKMRQAWDPAFLEHIKQLEAKKSVIFCGDFNVAHTELDLARPKENRGKKGFTEEERSGFESFNKAGFIDTFRYLNKDVAKYTWWSHFANARERNIGWRIDYILMSKSLLSLLKSAQIHENVFGSDHCPVSIELANPV